MGRRGLVLLLFGIAWVVQGLAILIYGQMGTGGHFIHEQIPPPVLGALWASSGALSVACSPSRRHPADTLGYLGVTVMPMLYGTSFLVGAVTQGVLEHPRWAVLGVLGFSLWGAVALGLIVAASWPEPPDTAPLHKEGREHG